MLKGNLKTNIKSILSSVLVISAIILFAMYSVNQNKVQLNLEQKPIGGEVFIPEIIKNETQWREILTDQQYYVLRQKGTDIPFSETELLNENRKGTFELLAMP